MGGLLCCKPADDAEGEGHGDVTTAVKIEEITSSDQYHAVLRHASGLVVVDFYADWCGPCRKMAPEIERLASQYPGVKFCKLNTDENPDLEQLCRIQALPTINFYKDSEVVKTVIGCNLAEVNRYVEEYK